MQKLFRSINISILLVYKWFDLSFSYSYCPHCHYVGENKSFANCGLAMRKQCPRAHYCPHDNAVGIFNVNHTPYHTFTEKHSSVCPLRKNRSWLFLMLIPVCLVEWSVFRRLFFLWVEKCKNCKNDHMKAPCMTQRSNRLHLNVRLLIRPIWLSRKSAWVCS